MFSPINTGSSPPSPPLGESSGSTSSAKAKPPDSSVVKHKVTEGLRGRPLKHTLPSYLKFLKPLENVPVLNQLVEKGKEQESPLSSIKEYNKLNPEQKRAYAIFADKAQQLSSLQKQPFEDPRVYSRDVTIKDHDGKDHKVRVTMTIDTRSGLFQNKTEIKDIFVRGLPDDGTGVPRREDIAAALEIFVNTEEKNPTIRSLTADVLRNSESLQNFHPYNEEECKATSAIADRRIALLETELSSKLGGNSIENIISSREEKSNFARSIAGAGLAWVADNADPISSAAKQEAVGGEAEYNKLKPFLPDIPLTPTTVKIAKEILDVFKNQSQKPTEEQQKAYLKIFIPSLEKSLRSLVGDTTEIQRAPNKERVKSEILKKALKTALETTNKKNVGASLSDISSFEGSENIKKLLNTTVGFAHNQQADHVQDIFRQLHPHPGEIPTALEIKGTLKNRETFFRKHSEIPQTDARLPIYKKLCDQISFLRQKEALKASTSSSRPTSFETQAVSDVENIIEGIKTKETKELINALPINSLNKSSQENYRREIEETIEAIRRLEEAESSFETNLDRAFLVRFRRNPLDKEKEELKSLQKTVKNSAMVFSLYESFLKEANLPNSITNKKEFEEQITEKAPRFREQIEKQMKTGLLPNGNEAVAQFRSSGPPPINPYPDSGSSSDEAFSDESIID